MKNLSKKLTIPLAICAIGGTGVWYFLQSPSATQSTGEVAGTNTNTETQTLFPTLSGQLVSENEARKRPLAIIVENFPDSRPQSGLNKADIVFETLAEGGVTRFLALYQTSNVDKVGPIRSARPYFLEIASIYSSVFAHVGGSDEAISKIKNKTYPSLTDADEYFLERFFYRDKKHFAPHNVYTTSEKLYSFLTGTKDAQTATPATWKFGDLPAELNATGATEIIGNFSLQDYLVRFQYDATSDSYLRQLAGKPHLDAETKSIISTKNVVVMYTDISEIPRDPKLRVTVDTTSGGKSTVYRNGKSINGTWKRIAEAGFKFYAENGQEIPLAQGPTWVLILPRNT